MSNQPADNDLPGLPIQKHDPPPADVPVFNCVVYVSPHPQGGTQARVGNLAGLSFQGASEREVLGKVVTAFKQHVGQLTEQGEEIEWIEPPLPPEPGEQTRFIPVHL